MLLYFIIGCFLFPLSKFTIERVALKYTTRKFWTTGFFADDIGKSGLVAIYWLVVFLFFPISFVIFAFNLSSKAM
ncbi:colicin E1 family microcin immunity protein [Pantoea sp. USMM078]